LETITTIVTAINDFVWGPPMLVLILGTGLLLQLRLKLMPILRIGTGFKMVWKGRHPAAGAAGDISPYAALMTALAPPSASATLPVSPPRSPSAGRARCSGCG